MYRQGDLLIVKETIPDWAKQPNRFVKDGIVERGEATGHAHRLIDGEVWGDGAFLRTNGISQLTHDEHDTIVLPEGEYRVLRQREFLSAGEWSTVND